MAIFMVTTLNDESNGSTGGLSLREAIQLANASTGADTINFAVNGTIDLSLGELLITDSLTINGDTNGDGTPNITIDANQSSRVLKVDDGTSISRVVTLNGLNVTGGFLPGGFVYSGSDADGAGIQNSETLTITNSTVSENIGFGYYAGGGGGIASRGTLTLINSAVTNNYMDAFKGIGGGGIFSDGNLTLVNSTVSGNETGAFNRGGGIRSYGNLAIFNSDVSNNSISYGSTAGGIEHNGLLLINNSTVNSNSADIYGYVGGIGASGDVTILNSTIDGNSSNDESGYGSTGGLRHRGGDLRIENSTISNNVSRNFGGGIFLSGGYFANAPGESVATIVNSTISGNEVIDGSGGGIIAGSNTTLNIFNSTIANNTAVYSGGVANFGNANTRIEVVSSIIAANLNGDVNLGSRPISSFVSLGNNLIGNGNAVGAFNQPTDITGVTNPGLAPLANNGGPTATHALLPGSPAIDAGSIPLFLQTDQRGFDRAFPQEVDIGSFEVGPEPLGPLVSISSTGTVQEGGTGSFTIARDGSTTGPLVVVLSLEFGLDLKTTDFSLTGGDITINGTTATVIIPDGAAEVNLTFAAVNDQVAEALETLTLTVEKIASYSVSADDGAATISIQDNDTFVTNINDFRGVSDSREGTLRQAILNANELAGEQTVRFAQALDGQAIILKGGALNIEDDIVVDGDIDGDNIADITVDGNQRDRVFTVSTDKTVLNGLIITGGNVNSTSGSFVDRDGFAIRTYRGFSNFPSYESLIVRNSIITGNTGPFGSGSIHAEGHLTIENSLIGDNVTSSGYGSGGVHSRGDLTIHRSTINGNTGIGAVAGRGLVVEDSTISNNTGAGIRFSNFTGDPIPTGTITNTTISGNSGTGVFHTSFVPLQIRNSTITNNEGLPSFSSSTIIYAGGITTSGSTASRAVKTEVVSSIIAGNANSDIIATGVSATVVSQGNNLIGTGNVLSAFNKPGDITGVTEPGLAALANNGGPTQTHAILATSPAFNGGSNPLGLGNDQRGAGFNRVEGGATDIGAFEANTIRGTGNRDTLTGTAFADIIFGTAKGDTITTGAGFDQIVYSALWQKGDVVRDFEVGVDKLVFAELLDNIDYGGSNPIADGVVRFARSGSNTVVRIDRDGFGNRFGAQDFLTLRNVSVAEANSADNFIF